MHGQMLTMLGKFLKTRVQRFFSLMLTISVVASLSIAYSRLDVSDPSHWYFFTTDGGSVDVQSPTGTLIIDADIYPRVWMPAYARMREELSRRCDMSRRRSDPDVRVMTAGAIYREIELCNTIGAIGQDFNVRHQYFKTRVDKIYRDYYGEIFGHFGRYFLFGILLWSAMLASWLAGKWVLRGRQR